MIHLGPIALYTWGLFVSAGILAGFLYARQEAKKRGVLAHDVADGVFWILLAAFLGARLSHVFLYDWGYYRANLWEIPQVWHGGLSSFGGFAGALVAAAIFARARRINFTRYAETLIVGLPLGLAIGRVGCYVNRMHPGVHTNLPIGVRYPDGVRFDLGLMEAFSAALLFGTILLLARRTWPVGFFMAVVMLWYGTVRFFSDFLRIEDARYLGLTPAQYGSLGLVFGGLFLFANIARKKRRGAGITSSGIDPRF
ncbi:MAG: prolipoprotein diacylglyceryl transferase [Patescibacteria group bacterium]